MSKRVANTREKTARNRRVRYGWRVKQAATNLEVANDSLAMADIEEKAREKFEMIKAAAIRVLPKRLLRRHQSR